MQQTAVQHTPGPWVKGQNCIEDAQANIIATASYEQSGYVQANAHLIAAAPDLLEAAQAALYAMTHDDKEVNPNAWALQLAAIEQLTAAIAQATGNQS